MEERNYRRRGATIFLSLAAAITFFFLLFRIQEIANVFSFLLSAIKPVIVGAALAYLLCPVAKFFERLLKKSRAARRGRCPFC